MSMQTPPTPVCEKEHWSLERIKEIQSQVMKDGGTYRLNICLCCAYEAGWEVAKSGQMIVAQSCCIICLNKRHSDSPNHLDPINVYTHGWGDYYSHRNEDRYKK